jgi:hypothetical protein
MDGSIFLLLTIYINGTRSRMANPEKNIHSFCRKLFRMTQKAGIKSRKQYPM